MSISGWAGAFEINTSGEMYLGDPKKLLLIININYLPANVGSVLFL